MPIFDQGYQHWSGNLSSHAWRWLAIARHGVRTGLKLPRLKRTLFIAWLPALGLAGFLCIWGLIERKADLVSGLTKVLTFLGPDPRMFRVAVWTLGYTYFMEAQLWVSMVLVLLVGPNLISQDLRFNALPLYFSRPLRRIDYFVGKLGVIGGFLGMVMVAPAVIAYVLGMLFSLDFTIIADTLPILIGAILYGLLIVVSAGTAILALSSLSRNSRYVSLLWIGIWFVSSILSTILVTAEAEHQVEQQARRAAVISQRYQGYPGAGGNSVDFEDMDQQIAAHQERDWRPIVSYMENLRRVGRHLMGTNAAWETFLRIQPPQQRLITRMQFMGPQYPWYWSLTTLAVIFAISVCILHFRVRSLDRLK